MGAEGNRGGEVEEIAAKVDWVFASVSRLMSEPGEWVPADWNDPDCLGVAVVQRAQPFQGWWGFFGRCTQGGSFLATLGLVTQSFQD